MPRRSFGGMETPTIPTAEEFWELTSPNEEFGMLAELKRMNLDRHVFESMRRFAKLHVDAALKCAAENAVSDEPFSGVSKESILNSYDLNNIK